MIEGSQRLEAMLSRLRPRCLSQDLTARIGQSLGERPGLSWPDRFLLSAMAAGALAACTIVGLLVATPVAAPPAAPPVPAYVAAHRVGDYPIALARSDDALDRSLK